MLVFLEVTVLVSLVLYCLHKYTRFSTHRVKHNWPIPLLGNFGPVAFGAKHFSEIFIDTYNGFPEDRFVGTYELVSPVIVPRDIELIKKIAIQDYDYFVGHRMLINEEIDPLFARGILLLKGSEWKDIRFILSPAFTNAKIKNLLPFFMQKSEQIANRIKNDIEASDSKFIDVDIKLMASRYLVDSEAAVYFGKAVDSFTDPENIFYKIFRTSSNVNFTKILKFLGCYSSPYMMKLFSVRFYSPEVIAFFNQLVLGTIDDIKVDDDRVSLIHILKKAQKVGWNDNDLIAQALFFVGTALNTVSTTISFLLYELACNPEVQEKLTQEIREHRKPGAKFDNKTIQDMAYLDMVVSETLRLWPPIPATDRVCSRNYNLGRPNDKCTQDYVVRKGEDVVIPIIAIHRDPQHFSDPLKFDPERFSEENKLNIKPYTYMPFGVGPRYCIGPPLAKSMTKSLVVNLLDHLEVVPFERTTIPAKISTNDFTLALKGGHWLRMKMRKVE